MKKILITGANSYIGTSFEQWVHQWPDQYMIDTVDMIDGTWKEKDFSEYDVVFHVAGIAHVDTKNATKETQDLYYKINRDLTIETATKAKKDGVKQFIFMSSIIVYGESSPIGELRVITKDTIPKPSSFYGDSKLQAEKGILPLQSDDFNIVVLRPPMIYGKGSKGNYPRLAKLARVCPIFPDIDNKRSMLYVDNLCEFIRLLIDNRDYGIYYPQNREYVKTTDLFREIADFHGNSIYTTKLFNPIINLLKKRFDLFDKVFGNQVYNKELSNYKDISYYVSDFKQSINLTETNE